MLVRQWSGRLLLTSLSVVGLMGVSAHAQPGIEYSAGHADIGLAYEGGELELHYHFGVSAVLDPVQTEDEFDPGEVYTRVADSLGNNFASTPAGFGFTGMTPDGDPATSDLWFLTQVNTPGTPFLGIASEELTPADWVGSLSYRLTNVQFMAQGEGVPGQGYFSLWQDGFTPTVFMASSDGIDGTDVLTTSIGGHDHFNYGFTEQGVYQVTIEASGTHVTDGLVSDTETFWFAVGDSTVIPEPASLALLGLGGGLVLMRRRSSAMR